MAAVDAGQLDLRAARLSQSVSFCHIGGHANFEGTELADVLSKLARFGLAFPLNASESSGESAMALGAGPCLQGLSHLPQRAGEPRGIPLVRMVGNNWALMA